ncbi:MAG: FAD-binding domain-containing protein [Pseudomonadota bacterium]
MKRQNEQALQIVWFKRDLRVVDHQPLVEAARRGPVLPLLVVEPEWWSEPDMSERQYAFYCECVAELATALSRVGLSLLVRTGRVTDVLSEISRSAQIGGLWSHEETGGAWTYTRDQSVGAWCKANGVAWTEVRQDGVQRRLATRNGWARHWDLMMGEPTTPGLDSVSGAAHPIPADVLPTSADLGLAYDRPSRRQVGGRAIALETLQSFLTERGETYRADMSSPVSGEAGCSRMSPYLAWGTVSMREVAQATWTRQRELKAVGGPTVRDWRASLVSFTGRLHWHCHFMQKLEDEPQLEFSNLHPAYNSIRQPNETDPALLAAWCKGETGLPFVDACMRYLAATGWLNFRMRAMLMATASYHLWMHWREPGLHLARQFTDYEPGIHWPQSQMQSGTTGINTVRIYNPVKQGHDQDPDGDFVRRWVPELAAIPGGDVHEPWAHALGSAILDKSYPMPVVDHQEAARAARQKIYGARRGPAFRETANEIQDKHGSRKSGMPMTGQRGRKGTSNAGQRKRSSKTPEATAQLTMDLAAEPAPLPRAHAKAGRS